MLIFTLFSVYQINYVWGIDESFEKERKKNAATIRNWGLKIAMPLHALLEK